MELADIFGGSIGGLLSPEDQQKLTNQALLSAGLGILAGSAGGARRYAGMPDRPSLGQALLQGFQQGSGAYMQGAQNLVSARDLQEKMAQKKRQQELNAQVAPILQGGDKYQAYMAAGNKASELGDIDTANKYYELALKFQPKEKERKTATVGNVVIDVETGKPIYEGQKDLKAPPTRDRQVGRMKVQEELQPDGTWKEIGRGAMDAPQQPQRASYSTFTGGDGQVYRINSLTGVAEPVAIAGSGKPLTGPNAGGKPTEDQAKAAGWLAQATNAYANMTKAMKSPIGPTGAESPRALETALSTIGAEGLANFNRSPARQQFVQASKSLSEALLRAATGAGVTEAEARQKIEEITPQYFDDATTREQKLKQIPIYIESLKVRAGAVGEQVQDKIKPILPTGARMPTKPQGKAKTVDFSNLR